MVFRPVQGHPVEAGIQGLRGGSVVKSLPANAGDVRGLGLIPGLGRFPGEVNGNPLRYSCLENPMDRGAWRATVYADCSSFVTDSRKSQSRLSDHVIVTLY